METQQTEHHETLLDNPIPLLLRAKRFLFGEEKPDGYTQVTFYINLILWAIFFLWSCISYFAISLRTLIEEQKSIPVEGILMNRGIELGFQPNDFLDRLTTFHLISILCWIAVLVGLIFLWRKDLRFVYYYFGGTAIYIGMMLFYLNLSYYTEDTTFFDKISFIAMNAFGVMYYFLLKKEKNGGSLSFFGEEDSDDE
jgi:hypothetical protein